MVRIDTLLDDLRRILGDDLGFIFSEERLLTALREAQQRYLKRTKAYRKIFELEPYTNDMDLFLPKSQVRIEYSHNSRELGISQVDYHTALYQWRGRLETEHGIPEATYELRRKEGIRAYPIPEGDLDIFDWDSDFGLTLSLEGIDITGDFGIVGDGEGILLTFSLFDGEKITANVSLSVLSDFILVRFPEALSWKAAAELTKERRETENIGISDLYQQVFNKYIADDIRLLKRRIGIKANGGNY